jgi:cardiolipin synthase (CMP-forming)
LPEGGDAGRLPPNGGNGDGPAGDNGHRPRRDPAASLVVRDSLVTLPNLITMARLCAVPATVWLILNGRLDLAFWLFVAAGVSDAVDGWVARVRNARSALGAILDPMADKLLLVCVFVTLAATGVLPDWLAILVVFRDLVIVGGVLVLWVLGQPPKIRPLFISKANTVAQIALAALALLLAGFGLRADGLLTAVVWTVAGTTFASGAAYVAATLRRPERGAGEGA